MTMPQPIQKIRAGHYAAVIGGTLWECFQRYESDNGTTGWWEVSENGNPCDLVRTLAEFRRMIADMRN